MKIRIDERSAVPLNTDNVDLESGVWVSRFGKIETLDADGMRLSDAAIVEQLVAGGASRLTAERIVAIESGEAEIGRARQRTHARR
jgi:hypothetical protein